MRHLRAMLAGAALSLVAAGAGAQTATPQPTTGVKAATGDTGPAAPAPPGPSDGFSSRGPHHVYLVGSLLLTEPWLEVDAGDPGQALAYFTIQNRGTAPDRLVTATTPAASAVVVDSNGEAPGLGTATLDLPPGAVVRLGREGARFVLQGFHGDMAAPTLPVTLTFERAGPMPMDFATRQAGADQEELAPAAPDAIAPLAK